MKFTVLHGFKTQTPFEAGNTHDSVVLGIEDSDVERWYRQGWVQIEGRTPAPAIDPQRTELSVHNSKIGVRGESV